MRRRGSQLVHARRTMRLTAFALLLGSTLACDRRATPSATDPAPSSPAPLPSARQPRPLVDPLRLAHARGFEFIALTDGALLITVEAGAPGAIRARRLDRHGRETGASFAVTSGNDPIVEIAAAARGARGFVVWAAGVGDGIAVRSAVGDLAARSFAPHVELGASVADGDVGSRFALSVGDDAGDEAATLLYRTRAGDCGAANAGCASFAFAAIGGTNHERRGFPLVVPEPCPLPLVGYVGIGRRSYYGLCSRAGGTPKSTIFALQPEPMYAGAEVALSGCTPLGALRLGNAAAFVAQCGPERSIARAEIVDRPPSVVPLEPSTRCAGGAPVIDSAVGAGFHWPLTTPQDRLELLLPRAVASARGRAVWTGGALLVAEASALSLRFRRFECRGERLAPTDLE
jgi:hypothetical protein